MILTKSDKDWIESTLKDVIQDQEDKFEAKIVEVKSDFYEKIDPILIENIEKKLDIQPTI